MDKGFEYPRLYEELHRDIETFNEELETFNKRNEASFQDLLAQIEGLIKNRFPGDFWFWEFCGILRNFFGLGFKWLYSRFSIFGKRFGDNLKIWILCL